MNAASAGPLSSYQLGDGPLTTVLLHGFLGSGRNLRGLAVRWVARDPRRRLVVMDLPGHGGSPALADGAGLDELADAVVESMDALGTAWPIDWVGHSLGGRVALAAARGEPGCASSITLLDIAPGPIDPASSLSRAALDALLAAPDEAVDRAALRVPLLATGMSPGTADWLLTNVVRVGDRVRWRFDRAALDRLHDRVSHDDLWPVVEGGALPVRCLRGGRSRYVTDADVDRLRAAGGLAETIAEAGHDVHVDSPDRVVDWLARWLSAG